MSQSEIYDVCIIGGGPAGTAAGLTLLQRPGTRVAIIERSDYSGMRAGESLSPGTRPLLEYLGVWQQFTQQQTLQTYGSQAAWGSPELSSLDYLFTLHGNGWALDRRAFDAMLAEQFSERGGELLTHHRLRGYEQDEDNLWCLQVESAGESQQIRCRYVIDASGRNGVFTKLLGATRQRHDRMVGLNVTGRLNRPVKANIQIEACKYGWWYATPLPGEHLAVVLMTDSDIASDLQASQFDVWLGLLAATQHSSALLDSVEFEPKVNAYASHTALLDDPSHGYGWLAVGDCVASHDPLSSSGIPHALASGVQGARAAANQLFDNGQLLMGYKEGIAQDFYSYMRTRSQYYFKEQRWPQGLFWKRRNTRIQLDPHAEIGNCFIKRWPQNQQDQLAAEKADPLNTTLLSNIQRQHLVELCQPGELAHEIVAAFKAEHNRVPDEQIILSLQQLRDRGLVEFR